MCLCLKKKKKKIKINKTVQSLIYFVETPAINLSFN